MRSNRLSDRSFAARVFALALALRLLFLAYWQWKGIGDVYGRDRYFNLALSWLGWLPPDPMDATHPPFYTLFICAVLWLFHGPNPVPVLAVQCLLSSAVCLLVWRLGAWLASESAGRLAAVWVALDPPLIFFTPQLQTETFFIFMEAALFCLIYRCLDSERDEPGHSFVAGLWGGLAALTRSAFGAFPAFLILALLKMGKLGRHRVFAALFCAGWAIPLAAWTARNFARYHRFVPLSAQMGWNLYEGFTLDRETVRRHPVEMGAEMARLGITDPVEKGRYYMDKTLRFIREHPLESLGIVVGKAFLYWRPWLYDPYTPAQRVVLTVYFTALFAFALLGAWVNRAAAARWWPVYALLLCFTATHAVFATFLRYRMPLEPFLCLMGATGAAGFVGGLGGGATPATRSPRRRP